MRASKIALAVASTLLAVALLEVGVRVLLPPPVAGNFTAVPPAIRQESNVPGLRFGLRPGAVVRQLFAGDPRGYFGPDETLTYRINALGLRGPESTLEKPPGRFRILAFGDSFTFGTGVREEDTWIAVLRRGLQGEGVPAYEVLNFGIPAVDTSEEVALLRHRGLAFEPDLVIVCVFLNDAGGGAAHAAFDAGPRSWELPAWRRSSQLIDRVLRIRESRVALRELARSYNESFAEDSPGWRRARAALREARRLAEEHDFELALVLFPVLYQLSGDYPFEPAHRALRRFAASEDLPLLDLRPAFAGHDGPELWAHPTNQHPNDVGHRIAGQAVRRFLEAEGLLAR